MTPSQVLDRAYTAALIDTLAVLRLRTVRGTQLPIVAIHGSYPSVLTWLAERTGTQVVQTVRDYHRGACEEHCPGPHVHIQSMSGRWQVTGVRATILLYNIRAYMKFQVDEAQELIEAGLAAGYSGSAANSMAQLGWTLPALRHQPRARVSLRAVR